MLIVNITVLFCCRGKFDNFVGSRKKSSTNTTTKINNGNLNNTKFYITMLKNDYDRNVITMNANRR